MTSPGAGAPVDERAEDLPSRTTARSRLGLALFALLAYVPPLLTGTGKVVSDTKSYLYIDPSRFLANVSSIWNSQVGLGTVDHQILGYLFPMGPFYWVLERAVHMPPWVAERLWLGTLICLAGLGMRYLLRALAVGGPGVPVAMLAYAFTPYVIQFATQLSALLAPWAALPWMMAFVVLALRRGGWKYPALLAITVQLAGSVNGSSLTFVLLGPALWIPYAVFVVRESDWRRAWTVVWRTGALTFVASLWWISGLAVESGYGLNLLRFTETIPSTSATTSPIEVLRGLGYWYFYGRDGLSLWNAAMPRFTQEPASILVSLLLPALALLAAVAVRWRYRAYFVLLVLVGVAMSVGAQPYSHASPLGASFKALAASSTVGLALRNTDRAVPLIVLGIAVLLASLVSAVDRRLRERGLRKVAILAAVLVGALCLANAPGIWDGSYYSPYLEWRAIPTYWQQAMRSLDAQPHDTRVLELPGASFAVYRWGDVLDPIAPGLSSRPYVTRQQAPVGSEATASLLQALDGKVQADSLDPNALAPLARLMGVGDVLLDMDLQTARYGLISARLLWQHFTQQQPAGLGPRKTFGPRVPRKLLVFDPVDVAQPPLTPPPRVAVLPVEQPLPIVHAASAADPLVIDGDADGLVDVATVGLLDPQRLVLFSPSFEQDPAMLRGLPPGAALIVTDSNRNRPRATDFLYNFGPTLQAGEQPLVKSSHDQPFDVFPRSTSASQTVTILRGAKSVRATSGAQPFSVIATRPSKSLDGNLQIGWLVDSGAPVGRERLRIQFDKPITTDHVNLVQPLGPTQGRWITGITLRFDGRHDVKSDLGRSSRTSSGQTVRFPLRTFSTLEIQVDHIHHKNPHAAVSAVGFAEVRVSDNAPGARLVRVSEDTRMPLDLLTALGKASLVHALTFEMSRDPMDDTAMNRQISLPTARAFTISGTAQLSSVAGDDEVGRSIGLRPAAAGGVTVKSSPRGVFDEPLARAPSAIDGNLATAWNTPLASPKGWMEVALPHPISFDHLELHLVDDGRHSVPTALKIQSDDGSTRLVDLLFLKQTPGPDRTVSVPARFSSITGRKFTFTITNVKPKFGYTRILEPSAIAELGIPGVKRTRLPAQLPSRCVDNLLTVDGKPFAVRVKGTTSAALHQQPLSVQPCHADEVVKLGAGIHEIRAGETPATRGAFDMRYLVLSSGAGGGASPPALAASSVPPSSSSAPPIHVLHQSNTSVTLRIDSATKPFWLVFGQSYNRGWVAKADGHDLGRQILVDGYANGWLVRPSAPGKAITITLNWTPQRLVRAAIPLSALAFALCLGIVGFALVRERRRRVVIFAHGAPPTLRRPFLPSRLERRRGAVIGTVVAAGVAAGLLATPWIAPIVAAAVLLAILRPRWHRAVRLAPAVIVAAVAIYVAVAQILQSYAPVFQWPTYFDAGRLPVWIALLLLAADALIAIVWRTDLDDGETDALGA